MTATALPPAAKSTMNAVREGLADIRDRVADIESMPEWDKLAEIPGELIDRATGRKRRRPAWPLVALGVVAVIGIAAAITMFMMNRTSMDKLADELESDVDRPWTPAGSTGGASASGATGTSSGSNTVGTFPASDPMPSSMSPSIGS